MKDGKGEVIFYEMPNGGAQIEVTLENETLWLSQTLIGELFDKDFRTVAKHIKNIYAEGELEEDQTTTLFNVVQSEGQRKISRHIKYYNLDVILSVGYRVSSKRGTAFSKWANTVLKDYLVKGFAHNEKLLREKQTQLDALKQAVSLITNVTSTQAISGDEAAGLLRVLTDYTYALDVLDKYDHQVLEIEATSPKQLFQITYNAAMEAIAGLKDKFGGSTLFGNEKDQSFQGSLAAIYQTFGGADLYPSVEEKAANLLYF